MKNAGFGWPTNFRDTDLLTSAANRHAHIVLLTNYFTGPYQMDSTYTMSVKIRLVSILDTWLRSQFVSIAAKLLLYKSLGESSDG